MKEEKDKSVRVGARFQKELDNIKEQNKRKFKIKGKQVSNGNLTNMIPKHSLWETIKEDLINFHFDKRGLTTMGVFLFIFFVFIWIVLIGIFGTIFNLTYTNLNIDVDVGQVNLGEIVQATFGQINNAFLNTIDILAYVVIFGLILNLFLSAYIFRGEYPRLFILIDIILLVFAYIVAVYLTNAYEILINSAPELSIYINEMSKSSTFILNLPKFVGIIGVIVMILSYAGFPRETEDEILVGQFEQ